MKTVYFVVMTHYVSYCTAPSCRHQVLCEVFSHAMRGGHYQGYHCGEISTPSHRSDGQEKFELAFQVRAGRLFAQCIECSFYEQVT